MSARSRYRSFLSIFYHFEGYLTRKVRKPATP
jgi:hypothetical protein